MRERIETVLKASGFTDAEVAKFNRKWRRAKKAEDENYSRCDVCGDLKRDVETQHHEVTSETVQCCPGCMWTCKYCLSDMAGDNDWIDQHKEGCDRYQTHRREKHKSDEEDDDTQEE